MTVSPFKTPEQQSAHRLTQKLIQQGYRKQALHCYTDKTGKPIYWRIRLKHPGNHKKWIRPLMQDDSGDFILKEPHFSDQKPLYHLHHIIQHPDAVVWIVEGEWCADQLRKYDFVVTTSGSKESAQNTDWTPLANRRVVVWPDNDVAGLEYANTVSALLKNLNCQISWVAIHQLNLPAKGDCVDWLQGNPHATHEVIEALPLCTAEDFYQQRDSQEKADSECLNPPGNQRVSENNIPAKDSSKHHPHFKLINDQLYALDVPREDEKMWICHRLEVAALVRDTSSENWGRLLVFKDADHIDHHWAMPMEMMKAGGEELRGELLRQGLKLSNHPRARQLLMDYIMSAHPKERAQCVDRTGWHQNMLILPDHSFGECSEIILCQQERSDKLYRQAGSLADWQEHVARYCIGNSRLLLAVSCAFAAMLLYPTQMESGGLHLVGESSSGKTTALRVAASVLGGHDYLHRWRATTNGLEALAIAHCDTLLILDELAQVEAKEAGEIAYMLANGSGKARAHKSGAAKRHAEWRTLFISAGEIGLSQHMQEVGKRVRAGQEVRLIDFPADASNGLGIFDTCHEAPSAPAFSQKLVKASAQYYGTAGIAFLKLITQKEHFTSLLSNFDSFKKIFLHAYLPPAASGQVYRVAERFSLIAFAGELASEHHITGWPEEMAFEAMGRCFQDWLNQRGSHTNQESTAMLQQVQAFLEAHALSRFEFLPCDYQPNPQPSESLIIHNRVGFRKINEAGETEYLILPEMFRREICQGFDHRQVCKILVQAGMLKQNQEGKNLTAHRLPGEGIKKCYHLIKTVPSNQLMNDDGS